MDDFDKVLLLETENQMLREVVVALQTKINAAIEVIDAARGDAGPVDG